MCPQFSKIQCETLMNISEFEYKKFYFPLFHASVKLAGQLDKRKLFSKWII